VASGVPRMKDEKQPDWRSFDRAHYWLDHSDLVEAHLGEGGWSAVAGVRLFVGTGQALLEHPNEPGLYECSSSRGSRTPCLRVASRLLQGGEEVPLMTFLL